MNGRQSPIGSLRWIAACWFLVGPTTFGEIPESPSPFVAGFERFARHGEISPLAAGELLLSELSCRACHSPTSDPNTAPKRGPRLNNAGHRLDLDWIKRFLDSPQKTKPGTTMPDMFAKWPAKEKTQAITALSAFLETQRQPFPVLKGSGLNPVPFEFWNRGQVQRGKELYHRIGCVACHEPDSSFETVAVKPSPLDQMLSQLDPKELAELGLTAKARRVQSVPHGNLPAKFTKQSLTFFLLDPEKTRPAARMPNFQLKAVEAANIAAYLLRDQKPKPQAARVAASPELIAKGKQLFSELKCNNCHEAAGIKPVSPAKAIGQLNLASERKCFGSPSRGVPHFALDDVQAAALIKALNTASVPRPRLVEDRLQTQLLTFNCYACHERGKLGGAGRYRKPYFETVGHVDIGDEGRLPPALTGVGRKLQPAWMKKVLAGKGEVRPFLKARMPQFPAHAVKPLPELFQSVDAPQTKPQTEAQVFGKLTGLADKGRVLLDNGCVQCHSFRGEALPGVMGVDLEGITHRVHPQWFQEFLLKPNQLKPRTRMPTFFPDGQSQNQSVFNGDPKTQIAAMWAYLKELDRQKLPEKIEVARAKNYELVPQDRPIVLRSFMKDAGPHAIAVGFPQGVHFAFDAETAGFSIAWRGRFLDAKGTWFSRFTPPADPLGENQIVFPEGVPFARLDNSKAAWPKFDPANPSQRYLGYRLDKAGVPTFLYRFEQFDIEDRIEPAGKQNLKRHLTITNRQPKTETPVLWFRPLVGKSVNYKAAWTYSNETGLTVITSKTLGHAGELRKMESGAEWIVPLSIKTQQTLEVNYQW